MANKLNQVVKKTGKQKPIPVKIVSSTGDSPAPYDDMKYRAKDALHTLARAAEIQRDKPLMKAVKAEAKSEIKRLSGVCGSKK